MPNPPRLVQHLLLRRPDAPQTLLAFNPYLSRNLTGRISNVAKRRTSLRPPTARTFTTTTSSPPRPTGNLPFARSWRTWPARRGGARQARQNSGSSKASPEIELGGPPGKKSLSERMKDMSKRYGWIVAGVYLGLSALDFPFCFLAVRLFGTERIRAVEHYIMAHFWLLAEKAVPGLEERRRQREALEAAAGEASREGGGSGEVAGGVVGEDKHEDASIWTQLILAYGVHKSLIFLRIPLTLMVTPPVVKRLRKWGWNIGRPTPKPKPT